MAEYVEIPDAAKEPKPLFPELPDFAIVREVRDWVAAGNPTYEWRGHTHTTPGNDEPVDFIGFFELPKGTEAPCPCCTPNHTKFGKGVVGWFSETYCIRLMGEHCFKRLNPEGYAQARQRFEQRQGRRATVAYLTANLHKKDECIRVLEAILPLAAHLDDLQLILGERVRQKLNVDLWQAVRESGNLKIAVRDGSREFSRTYATVAGYQLVDPARKKLVPTIETALRGFRHIPPAADVIRSNDNERNDASKKFSRSLQLAQEVRYDVDYLRKFVSVQTTATIRNWSMQPNATAQIYMRREGLTVFVGRSEESCAPIMLKDVIEQSVPMLPTIVVTPE